MNYIFKKTVLILSLFLPFVSSFSQDLSDKAYVKAVKEADAYYYYDQNYEKAFQLYQLLVNKYPQNSNLCAKLGICSINLDGKKAEAIQLLKMASLNVVQNEKEYSEYGQKAPMDTYLYVAIAYHQNDSLQKALTLYNEAKKKLSNSKMFTEEYIDNQIRDCRYALEMKKKPLTLITDLFAKWLVDYPGACDPVLAKNDSVFIFTQIQNGKTRILCSYKSGTWERPKDITEELGGFDRFYSNSLTGNGKLLIIYMDDGGDGNLYYSERNGSTWTKIKSLGKPICSIYWQSHGFITPDGNTLYFSSNMPGGEGELDIWYSQKSPSGKWGEPVNCGNIINTPYNEDTPFFDPQTGALLFSSVGHISMGGYDVFRSVKINGGWTNPVGMPYAFNNTLENTFFILNNNKPGFITSVYDEKSRTRNIYTIVAENPADKLTLAKGTVTLTDGMPVDPKQVKILLVDSKNPDSKKYLNLHDSSSFEVEIKPGDYKIFVSNPGYKTDTIYLNLPLYYAGSFVSVNSSLIPEKVSGGEFLSINNILFEFDSYKLTRDAISGLEQLKTILVSHPELKVVVSGFTDSRGSKEYNTKLADKRAQAVIDFLTDAGFPESGFLKKAYGKSDFVALNTYTDGTDNPEGRKYNRRVTFGIIDPKTGVVIRHESYTPEHLRQPHSMRYSIVLLKTEKNVSPSFFSSLTKDDLLFISSVRKDSASVYTLGMFFNKTDAMKYLEYARENGFDQAYIADQYELANQSRLSLEPSVEMSNPDNIDRNLYTVQVKATRKALDIKSVFRGLEGVKVTVAADGFYKYYYGEYASRSKANEALLKVKGYGFDDAFIKNLYLLLNE